MAAGFLQIGEVAERAELSLRTVRYYEEQGLVIPAKRSDGGFRLYTEEQVRRLLLIKQMKPLDFSVEQMRELLLARDALRVGASGAEAADAADAARETIARYAAEVAARVERLRTRLADAEAFAADLALEGSG